MKKEAPSASRQDFSFQVAPPKPEHIFFNPE
jgi:hypothetical protein